MAVADADLVGGGGGGGSCASGGGGCARGRPAGRPRGSPNTVKIAPEHAKISMRSFIKIFGTFVVYG